MGDPLGASDVFAIDAFPSDGFDSNHRGEASLATSVQVSDFPDVPSGTEGMSI